MLSVARLRFGRSLPQTAVRQVLPLLPCAVRSRDCVTSGAALMVLRPPQ